MRQVDLCIERIPVDELVPYEKNAKLHTNEQLEAVEASINEFGFRNPVLVWRNDDGSVEIVAGHARVQAAKNLGLAEVPCIAVDDLTDEQRRALTLVDNQTTMMTGFDDSLLATELDSLCGEFDLAEFGFSSYLVQSDDYGSEFSLSDDDAPQFKTVSLNLTGQQYEYLVNALNVINRDDCVMKGGNEYGDKVSEAVRQWAER